MSISIYGDDIISGVSELFWPFSNSVKKIKKKTRKERMKKDIIRLKLSSRKREREGCCWWLGGKQKTRQEFLSCQSYYTIKLLESHPHHPRRASKNLFYFSFRSFFSYLYSFLFHFECGQLFSFSIQCDIYFFRVDIEKTLYHQSFGENYILFISILSI